MAEVVINAAYNKTDEIKQCDIIKDVEYIEYVKEENDIIEVSKIVFPKVIVLTQACDLLQDYSARVKIKDSNENGMNTNITHDKLLISVIVAPIYNFEEFRLGEHLSQLNLKMQEMGKINKSVCKGIMQNENKRYHFLRFPEELKLVDSVIDFKHYFSCNILYLNQLYKDNYVCSIGDLYRESITQRFSNFLSRIGLPDPE